MLGETYGDVATALTELNSSSRFHSHYMATVKKLMAVDNHYYVLRSDQEHLLAKAHPLERNMMRYLLLFDKDLKALHKKAAHRNTKLFFADLYIGFGSLQATPEQIKEINDQISSFLASETEAVFIVFIGVLNHWVTLMAHKGKEN